MILVSGKHNTLNTEKQPTWLRIVYLGTLLIMGAYTGYFGAAGGVIVLVILTYITNEKFIVINAIKNVISGFAILRRVPEKLVRIFIATLAFVQSAYFFYTAYLR